jgi:hypothetical protein
MRHLGLRVALLVALCVCLAVPRHRHGRIRRHQAGRDQ